MYWAISANQPTNDTQRIHTHKEYNPFATMHMNIRLKGLPSVNLDAHETV